MEIAARFLASRPRTRWEVERRLRRAAATHEVIVATMERLAALGYVDDLAFARWWIDQRDRHAPRSRRLIDAELRQHGVQRAILETLRDEEAVRPPQNDKERAVAALERHLRGRAQPADAKALQRVGMFLVRRGFDPETVRMTLRAAADGELPTDD